MCDLNAQQNAETGFSSDTLFDEFASPAEALGAMAIAGQTLSEQGGAFAVSERIKNTVRPEP